MDLLGGDPAFQKNGGFLRWIELLVSLPQDKPSMGLPTWVKNRNQKSFGTNLPPSHYQITWQMSRTGHCLTLISVASEVNRVEVQDLYISSTFAHKALIITNLFFRVVAILMLPETNSSLEDHGSKTGFPFGSRHLVTSFVRCWHLRYPP